MRLLILFFVLSFSILSYAASDSDLSVRSWTDKDTVHIGDKITLYVEIALKKGVDVNLPEFEGNRLGDFDINDFNTYEKKSMLFGNRYLYGKYILSAYSVGDLIIPSIEVRYKKSKDVDWKSLKTAELHVRIKSLLNKNSTQDIKDIKGLQGVAKTTLILTVLTALLALLVITYRGIRKYMLGKIVHKTAYESAIDELNNIKAAFESGGEIKNYYVGISDCVRRYIEASFSIRAPEMTTEEFLNSITRSAILSSNFRAPLKRFLESCDLVKFAEHRPAADESKAVLDDAFKLINETRPAPQPEANKI